MKADGRGMSVAEHITIREPQARIGEAVWHLRELSIATGYYAHLASAIPPQAISITHLHF